jgi:TRAP transporter TAXI family solute receptor
MRPNPRRTVPWWVLAALLLVALLPGCRKGPDRDSLQAEIQAKLDRSFQEGLFEVEELVRRGSYPYEEEGDDRPRLLVYFDAEIAFARDYKLSDWDQLNIGSLISVLGATPLGVDGVNPDGNKAGDRLHVYGTSAYAREGEEWVSVERSAPASPKKPGKEPPPEELPYQGKLAELAELASQFNRLRDPAEMARFDARVDELVAESRRRLGQARGWVTIGAGLPAGEYRVLGKALEGTLRKAGFEAYAFETGGSIENAQLVDANEVLFAFAQNDIAYMAYEGVGLYQERIPTRDIVALCSLYPEAIQVVTRADSDVHTLADLRGKRIDVGVLRSGVRVNAVQVLRAAGIRLNDAAELSARPMDEALAALREGQVDAVFLTSAYPNRALTRLAGITPIRLVPLGEEVVAKLLAKHPFFVRVPIPARTYPDQSEAVLTVAVTAMLITNRTTPAVRVEQFLEHLYAHVPDLSRQSLQAYYIARDKGLVGLSIPVHPAARAFFEK